MKQQALGGGLTVAASAQEAGLLAAAQAAEEIVTVIESRGTARVVFASAPSQDAMLAGLASDPRIDWARVRSFHMDEYLGLPMDHPQAFGQWLQERLPAAALPGFERIDSTGDPQAEAHRYAELLREAPIDVTCLGIGVNGHIAFNEPHEAKFDDAELVRTVELETTSRTQQVDEGLFPGLDDVPAQAITLTVPALLGARLMVATVLGSRKARAVAEALTGPVTERCPASALRTHPHVFMYLDPDAAAQLEGSGAAASQHLRDEALGASDGDGRRDGWPASGAGGQGAAAGATAVPGEVPAASEVPAAPTDGRA